MSDDRLTIFYHRDFDGMVSGALLAYLLRDRGEDPVLRSVNYDQRNKWDRFQDGRRFAIVDFHFHPRAQYWFDHHPTTFLTEELEDQYEPSERWRWDPESLSCPPMILQHAAEHWGHVPSPRFKEMAKWSDVIDAAQFESVEQAIFGDEPALRIMRSLTASPTPNWTDEIATAMIDRSLQEIAERDDVERVYQRASRNRDKALEQFPPTVQWQRGGVLFYDASSSKIRRERFAPFYHYPDVSYAVGVIPTRAGFHITCGENPWNTPQNRMHVGRMLEAYGGGGHRAVGGANPPSLKAAREQGEEVAELLVTHLTGQPRA